MVSYLANQLLAKEVSWAAVARPEADQAERGQGDLGLGVVARFRPGAAPRANPATDEVVGDARRGELLEVRRRHRLQFELRGPA